MLQADGDQDDGRDDVRHDVVDGGRDEGDGVIIPHTGQTAEDEGAPERPLGAPDGEDDQGYSQPAVAVDAGDKILSDTLRYNIIY